MDRRKLALGLGWHSVCNLGFFALASGTSPGACGVEGTAGVAVLCPFTLTPAPHKTTRKACRNGPGCLSVGLQAALAGLAGRGVIGFVLILTGVKQEAAPQAHWPALTPAHRSPALRAGAGSRRGLDRTSITIRQQPRELSLRPLLQSFHNLARIKAPSGVFSTDDTPVSS